MKVYRVDQGRPCDIEGCLNGDAVVIGEIVGVVELLKVAICPECIGLMSDMNSDNKEFFASVCECECDGTCKACLALREAATNANADMIAEQLL